MYTEQKMFCTLGFLVISVLIIRPKMTEKLFTGMLRINQLS